MLRLLLELLRLLLGVLLACVSVASAADIGGNAALSGQSAYQRGAPYTGVLTWRGDNQNTGINPSEVILTPSNVDQTTFKRLFTWSITGYAYPQPLIVENVTISGTQYAAVVYVATTHNDVSAFNAANGTLLWGPVNFGSPVTNGGDFPTCTDLASTEIGIMGTPAIDPVSGTLYALARTTGGATAQKLHALDITTGTERAGWPVTIAASISGYAFVPVQQLQRASLRVANGKVYIAWASQCDVSPWDGWIMAVDTTTRAITAALIDAATKSGVGPGIWMSGAAPAIDTDGSLLIATGNGVRDTGCTVADPDYSSSIVRLNGTTLAITDFFTGFNYCDQNIADTDLGAGGVLMITTGGLRLGVVSGKKTYTGSILNNSAIYLVNLDNLGGFTNGSNNITQYFSTTKLGTFATGVFFNNVLFLPTTATMLSFTFSAGTFNTTPTDLGGGRFGVGSGGSPYISANLTTNGIVWALDNKDWPTSGDAALYAYKASDGSVLYNSRQAAASRDLGPPAVKFTVPVPFKGKVYVCGLNQCAAYGNF